MIIRLTHLFLVSVLLSGCTKRVQTSSHIGISGPATIGPGGSVLANSLTLSYEVESPEEVHLIADGKRVHTTLSGKGTRQIEAADGKLSVAGPGISFALPVTGEGDIKSDMTRNSAGQLAFEISLGGKKVMQLDCPNRPGFGSP